MPVCNVHKWRHCRRGFGDVECNFVAQSATRLLIPAAFASMRLTI